MNKWLRSVIGILAGAAQAYSGGLDWKHILSGLLIAGIGVVSQITGLQTSDVTSSGTVTVPSTK